MRQLLIVFLSVFVLFSCNKDATLTETTEGIQSMEKNGFHSNETGKLHTSTWEADLNRDYTDKCAKPDKVDVRSIEYQKVSGKVTEAERSTIEAQIQSEIAKKQFHPYAIDVNEEKGTVDLLFDDDGRFANPLLCDPVPAPGNTDCHFFDENLEEAKICDKFNEGVLYDPVYADCDCETSLFEVGTTAGAFASVINSNYPVPDNHQFWSDIVEVRYEPVINDTPWGIQYQLGANYLLWDVEDGPNGSCPFNNPACIDGSDMNGYYCNFFQIIEQLRPSNKHEFILTGVGYRLNMDGATFYDDGHWYALLRYGISNSCCDCCC